MTTSAKKANTPGIAFENISFTETPTDIVREAAEAFRNDTEAQERIAAARDENLRTQGRLANEIVGVCDMRGFSPFGAKELERLPRYGPQENDRAIREREERYQQKKPEDEFEKAEFAQRQAQQAKLGAELFKLILKVHPEVDPEASKKIRQREAHAETLDLL